MPEASSKGTQPRDASEIPVGAPDVPARPTERAEVRPSGERRSPQETPQPGRRGFFGEPHSPLPGAPRLQARRLSLLRTKDISGVSGTGEVAVGVRLPSGHIVIEWQTEFSSIGIYGSVDELLRVHGHDGATSLVWWE